MMRSMKITIYYIITVLLAQEVSSACPSQVEIVRDGFRYTRVQDRSAYATASAQCHTVYSGYLAHIKTENVSWLVDTIISGCDECIRFGLEYYDGDNGSSWYWSDNDLFDGIDPAPMFNKQSRWKAGEGDGSVFSSACVEPDDRTWLEVQDSDLHWFICETNVLHIQTSVTQLYTKVGEIVEIKLRVTLQGIDGPANIVLYKDRNYDSAINSTSMGSGSWIYEISSITESDAGTYEFEATFSDFKRTVTTTIIVQGFEH